jgi:hypothetical protein
VDGVTMVYNSKENNKGYVTFVYHVDDIDIFIRKDVI